MSLDFIHTNVPYMGIRPPFQKQSNIWMLTDICRQMALIVPAFLLCSWNQILSNKEEIIMLIIVAI